MEGFLEIIKNGYNGVLVEPANSAALSKAIIELIDNESMALKCAENGLLTVQSFSWNNVAERTLTAYYDTLKGR